MPGRPDASGPGVSGRVVKRVLLCAIAILLTAAFATIWTVPNPEPVPDTWTVSTVPEPQPVPDACELVSAGTVASLVGPTLPVRSESTTTGSQVSGSCRWAFEADTDAEDAVRRPYVRELYVFASTFSEQPCDPLENLPDARPVQGVGRAAGVEMTDATLVPDTITYCLDDSRSVTIAFLGVDQISGGWEKVPPDTVEQTLLQLAREAELRWADASRDTPRPPATASAPPAAVVDPCRLVSAGTAADLRLTTPPRPLGEAPSDDTMSGLDCLWIDPDPLLWKRLVVTVVAHADHNGHDAATWANLRHEQWTSAWTARELTGIAGPAAVASDGHFAVVRAVAGTFAIKVEFRHTPRRAGENVESPATAELEATAERVAREVLANLPR